MMKKTDDMTRQLNAVEHMCLARLKDKFSELYGFPAADTNVQNLRMRVAYRIQETFLGQLSDEDRAFLEALADKDPMSNFKMNQPSRMPKTPGTKLCRIWKGVQYEVTFREDGNFDFNGKTYKSLSAIAREITHTRWNGKIFFGVK
ncbi:MAG: DUF2924 domain-containing protein [Victivallaceae bacterium]|jgi:hypothetical protein